VLFNACSSVAGGPEPQEGGGLGQAQPDLYGLKVPLAPDEALACMEGTVATKEQFYFVLVFVFTCHILLANKNRVFRALTVV